MLTPQQSALLIYISDHIARHHGVAPTLRDMTAGIGLKSTSGVHRLLSGLVERGFIGQMPRRSRAIEIIRMPGAVDLVADFRRAAEALESEHGTEATVAALTDLIRDMSAKEEQRLLMAGRA